VVKEEEEAKNNDKLCATSSERSNSGTTGETKVGPSIELMDSANSLMIPMKKKQNVKASPLMRTRSL